MRVTNSMLTSNFLNNLNLNMGRLGTLQGQLALNRKYTHISDDPVAVIYSQQARHKLQTLDMYQTNVDLAQSFLNQTETSIMELNKLIQAAYEQCVDVSTDVKTDEDRVIASKYIGQLRDQVLTVLNSTFGDKYVFGGYNTTGHVDGTSVTPPFGYEEDADGVRQLTYNGLVVSDPANAAIIEKIMADVPTFDIGPGIRIEVTDNGVPTTNYDGPYGPANIYDLFSQFADALEKGESVEVVNKFNEPFKQAQNHTLSSMSDIGGRLSRLELMASRYGQDEISYTQMKSDAEDADQAELIMNYKMAEAVYKAALSTGAHIIQPTLMDFLR